MNQVEVAMKRVAAVLIVMVVVLAGVFADSSGTLRLGAELKNIYPYFRIYVSYSQDFKSGNTEGKSAGYLLNLTNVDGIDPPKKDVVLYAKVNQAVECMCIESSSFGNAAATATWDWTRGDGNRAVTYLTEDNKGTFIVTYNGNYVGGCDVCSFKFTWPTSTKKNDPGEYESTLTITYTTEF